MHYCQAAESDVGIQAAVVIAGFVGQYFVAVEAETAKVGQTWKEVAAVVAVAAAISVATVGVVVAPSCFAETFESLVEVVTPSVASYVATPAVEIVLIVSAAAAAAAAASVGDQLAGLSVDEIVSLVVGMSVGMHSYWLIGHFAGVGYLLIVIAVVEAERRQLVAVQTDL